MTVDPSRTAQLTWGFALAIGLVIAFLVSFWLATTLLSARLLPGSVDAELRWDLAFLNGTMGLFGLAAVLVAARLAFGRWTAVGSLALGVAGAGLTLSIVQELVLHEWAQVHIGQYEFDHVFPTALLSWATIGVAVSAFATLIAPRRASLAPSLGLWLAAAFIWLVTVSNIPGTLDGIEPESWALAVLIGLAAVYAAACVAVSVLRLRRA